MLRPGGRVAIAVWGPRERNPWLGVVFDAVSAQIGAPVPPPGIPGPFSLDDADAARPRLLATPGSADVVVGELPVPLRAASFDEWWARTTALAGPLGSGSPRCPTTRRARSASGRAEQRAVHDRRRARAPRRHAGRVGAARLDG